MDRPNYDHVRLSIRVVDLRPATWRYISSWFSPNFSRPAISSGRL